MLMKRMKTMQALLSLMTSPLLRVGDVQYKRSVVVDRAFLPFPDNFLPFPQDSLKSLKS